jgi:hypothetical protein
MFGFCPVCFSSEAALNATTMASVRGGDTGVVVVKVVFRF